jgi:hypothetical protein
MTNFVWNGVAGLWSDPTKWTPSSGRGPNGGVIGDTIAIPGQFDIVHVDGFGQVYGNIDNHGTITLDALGSQPTDGATSFQIGTSVQLTGGGTIQLSDSVNNVIVGFAAV